LFLFSAGCGNLGADEVKDPGLIENYLAMLGLTTTAEGIS
jgi:hypothetical protein